MNEVLAENQLLTINALRSAYLAGQTTPAQVLEEIAQKCEAVAEHNIWIHRLSAAELEPYLRALESKSVEELPLYGIPFAIKDNIDLAGIPTTAGCEAFRYIPEKSAFVVEQLLTAGAIPVGKTNLDQFATGLVGVRAPEAFGICKNSFNPEYVSGGSSSGSAVSVAKGLACFSLGTDTAGSGRVPAAFNNLVGIKPSKGVLSSSGMIPACRTLDSISIFAHTIAEAEDVLNIAAKYDALDYYSREPAFLPATSADAFTFAIPDKLEFFGNAEFEALFEQAVQRLTEMGGRAVAIDFEPFLECARLLYEGPWVAERYAAIEGLIQRKPETLHPTVRAIIEPAVDFDAIDTFKAEYRRAELQRICGEVVAQFDFVLTPTAGTIYTIQELLDEPIARNTDLGFYTNFMNLLDLAAIAVPAGFTPAGLPFGITLFSSLFSDLKLGYFAKRFVGEAAETDEPTPAQDYVALAVCGAHMSEMPLNDQLTELGATLQAQTTTSPNYRLYALEGGPPYRPGLARQLYANGYEIEVEVWRLPAEKLATFMSYIPSPLGIGTIELRSGEWVKGFVCEPYALHKAEDISELGSWRNYHPS